MSIITIYLDMQPKHRKTLICAFCGFAVVTEKSIANEYDISPITVSLYGLFLRELKEIFLDD